MSDETEEQSELTGSAEVTPAEVEELRRQLAEKQDRLLRALAEVDNVKRRTQREREDYVRYANEGLARDPGSGQGRRRRVAHPARAAQGAGAGGRHALLGGRRAVRSEPPRGDGPGGQREPASRHRRGGIDCRLPPQRARATSRPGRSGRRARRRRRLAEWRAISTRFWGCRAARATRTSRRRIGSSPCSFIPTVIPATRPPRIASGP